MVAVVAVAQGYNKSKSSHRVLLEERAHILRAPMPEVILLDKLVEDFGGAERSSARQVRARAPESVAEIGQKTAPPI